MTKIISAALTGIGEHPTRVSPRNMPASEPDFDFKFETHGEPKLDNMLAAARQFIADMDQNAKPRWLSFTGRSGCGKTHLAKRICTFWETSGCWAIHRESGHSFMREGRFLDWRVFARDIKGNWGLVDDLCDMPFLAIDDIGAEYDPSGFLKGQLDMILNQRLGKWTVITSNMSLKHIAEKVDARIASRMIRSGGEVIHTEGVDDYSMRQIAAL